MRPRVFVYIGAEMGKNRSGAVKSERVHMTPSEEAAIIRRTARAIQQGTEIKDLLARGIKPKQIEAARSMIASK